MYTTFRRSNLANLAPQRSFRALVQASRLLPSFPVPHLVVATKDNFVDGQEPLKYGVYRDHVMYHGTDRCQTANGREVYSYLEPDVAENARLRQAFEPSLCLPDVEKLGFPKNLHASYRAWYSPGGSSATLIYSSQVWGHAVVLPECCMC